MTADKTVSLLHFIKNTEINVYKTIVYRTTVILPHSVKTSVVKRTSMVIQYIR